MKKKSCVMYKTCKSVSRSVATGWWAGSKIIFKDDLSGGSSSIPVISHVIPGKSVIGIPPSIGLVYSLL